MSISGHLKELRKRLLLALTGITAGAIGGWFLYDTIMDYLTEPLVAMKDANTVINFPTIGAGLDLKMRVALWGGFLLSSPWWIYQIGAFIMPGLKRREKLYTVAFGAVGVLLFGAGAYSGLRMVPRAIEILQSFVPSEAFSVLQANTYVDFYLRLVILFGISFLLPEILVALNFLGVLSSRMMLRGWRWAVIVAFTFAAIANPLPSPWPMIIQAMMLVMLYLLAVLISWIRERYKLYGRRLRPRKEKPASGPQPPQSAGSQPAGPQPVGTGPASAPYAFAANQPPQLPAVSGVIVLAGGTAARLGGVSKPDVVVAGQRLLDRTASEIRMVLPAAPIVVVAPDNVPLPAGALRALEDPPLGGPLAGVAAGFEALRALPTYTPDSFIAVVTCDAPLAPRLYAPLLIAAVAPVNDGGQLVAGATPEFTDAAGESRTQYLHGVYRGGALEQLLAGQVRDSSVRKVFSRLRLASVPDTYSVGMDVDTWEDASVLEERLAVEAGQAAPAANTPLA